MGKTPAVANGGDRRGCRFSKSAIMRGNLDVRQMSELDMDTDTDADVQRVIKPVSSQHDNVSAPTTAAAAAAGETKSCEGSATFAGNKMKADHNDFSFPKPRNRLTVKGFANPLLVRKSDKRESRGDGGGGTTILLCGNDPRPQGAHSVNFLNLADATFEAKGIPRNSKAAHCGATDEQEMIPLKILKPPVLNQTVDTVTTTIAAAAAAAEPPTVIAPGKAFFNNTTTKLKMAKAVAAASKKTGNSCCTANNSGFSPLPLLGDHDDDEDGIFTFNDVGHDDVTGHANDVTKHIDRWLPHAPCSSTETRMNDGEGGSRPFPHKFTIPKIVTTAAIDDGGGVDNTAPLESEVGVKKMDNDVVIVPSVHNDLACTNQQPRRPRGRCCIIPPTRTTFDGHRRWRPPIGGSSSGVEDLDLDDLEAAACIGATAATAGSAAAAAAAAADNDLGMLTEEEAIRGNRHHHRQQQLQNELRGERKSCCGRNKEKSLAKTEYLALPQRATKNVKSERRRKQMDLHLMSKIVGEETTSRDFSISSDAEHQCVDFPQEVGEEVDDDDDDIHDEVEAARSIRSRLSQWRAMLATLLTRRRIIGKPAKMANSAADTAAAHGFGAEGGAAAAFHCQLTPIIKVTASRSSSSRSSSRHTTASATTTTTAVACDGCPLATIGSTTTSTTTSSNSFNNYSLDLEKPRAAAAPAAISGKDETKLSPVPPDVGCGDGCSSSTASICHFSAKRQPQFATAAASKANSMTTPHYPRKRVKRKKRSTKRMTDGALTGCGGGGGGNCQAAVNRLQQRRKTKLKRKNIISAKLSVMFLVMSGGVGLLLNFSYSRLIGRSSNRNVDGSSDEGLMLATFVNAIVFDIVLVICSPVLLLYSSQELRKSIVTKLTKRTRL